MKIMGAKCKCGQPNCSDTAAEMPIWANSACSEVFSGFVGMPMTGQYKKLDNPTNLLDGTADPYAGHSVTKWEYE